MDVILQRTHPLRDVIQDQVAQLGGLLFPCDGSQWQAAIDSGCADWIVLIDERAQVTAEDFQRLPQNLTMAALRDFHDPDPDLPYAETAPIWLQPVEASSAAERFVGEHCPAAVALCWNNPAHYSLICIKRSVLTALTEISSGHPEPIWDWLIRTAGRPERVTSTTPGGAIGSWVIRYDVPAGQISRPESKDGPLSFVASSAASIPGLISHRPRPEIEWLVKHIERTKPSQFITDSDQASIADSVAIKAGLLLWHDAADASHQLSQSIEGLGKRHAGDYWHAILHRREPDYGNAKYWFRQFHLHPVMSELIPYATRALQDVVDGQTWKGRLTGKGSWDPFAFVDLCEACAGNEGSPLGIAARRIQAAEMQLLMAATYLDASGCFKNSTFDSRGPAPDVHLNARPHPG
jgi:hypothetical protein